MREVRDYESLRVDAYVAEIGESFADGARERLSAPYLYGDPVEQVLQRMAGGCRLCGTLSRSAGLVGDEHAAVCGECVAWVVSKSPIKYLHDGWGEREEDDQPFFLRIRQENRPQYVYVFAQEQGEELVKIGVSVNPDDRRSALECSSGVQIKIVGAWQLASSLAATYVEKVAHRTLAPVRRRGEWFACRPFAAVGLVESIMRREDVSYV